LDQEIKQFLIEREEKKRINNLLVWGKKAKMFREGEEERGKPTLPLDGGGEGRRGANAG